MELTARVSSISLVVLTWAILHLVAAAKGRRVFMVSVGRALSAADRGRSRRFRVVNGAFSLAAVAVVLVTHNPALATWVSLGVTLALTVVFLIEVALLVRTAEPERPATRYQISLDERRGASGLVSVPMQVANAIAMLAGSLAFLAIKPHLGERVATQFDAAGRPIRWETPNGLWMFLAIMLFETLLMWLILWAIASERRALPLENAEHYAHLQRQRRRHIAGMLELIVTGSNITLAVGWAMLAYASLPGREGLQNLAILLLIVVPSGLIVLAVLRHMTPLTEIGDALADLGGEALGTRPDGWRGGGLFYYAPDDPALFVPNLRGVGQTINFGRPMAWVILIGPLLLAVLPFVCGGR